MVTNLCTVLREGVNNEQINTEERNLYQINDRTFANISPIFQHNDKDNLECRLLSSNIPEEQR